MRRLSTLEWRIGQAPWISVFNTSTGKMITAKENVTLLNELLYVHIAPASKGAIARARKAYKDIRGAQYPVSELDLLENHVPHEDRQEEFDTSLRRGEDMPVIEAPETSDD
jgi:DNA sulfur modification protein DndB